MKPKHPCPVCYGTGERTSLLGTFGLGNGSGKVTCYQCKGTGDESLRNLHIPPRRITNR